jgi:hypothetical protein
MLSGGWNLMPIRFCAIALVILGCLGPASFTQAQDKQVEADFKGAVGLGLVGAELGAVIPALVGVEATWAYIVFPVVGAAGGALGGYFALDNADKPELSVIALTAGMALILPALIATLQLTAYDEDDQPPPAPGTFARARTRPAERARKQLAAGPGMVRMSEGKLALSAPGLALVPGARGDNAIAGLNVSLMSGQF